MLSLASTELGELSRPPACVLEYWCCARVRLTILLTHTVFEIPLDTSTSTVFLNRVLVLECSINILSRVFVRNLILPLAV